MCAQCTEHNTLLHTHKTLECSFHPVTLTYTRTIFLRNRKRQTKLVKKSKGKKETKATKTKKNILTVSTQVELSRLVLSRVGRVKSYGQTVRDIWVFCLSTQFPCFLKCRYAVSPNHCVLRRERPTTAQGEILIQKTNTYKEFHFSIKKRNLTIST